MLEFGSAVAELNPIAKTVLAVCTRAWERLEEQQKSSEDLDDLATGLAGMVPLVDEVKKYAQLESLRQTIEEFLRMIEDVSIFVLERKTKGFVVQVFRSVVDSSDKDQVEELVKRFQKTKCDFDTAIGVQTMAMVATADERELLKQLNPVEPSGHNPSWGCQDGTRLGVLGYVDDWIVDHNPSSSFMWIYGQAGIGKSTILTSVCNRLSEKGIPMVSFFCKRDDPALRDPLRLVNSVAHGLACRYPPYGKRVVKAIEANSELCTSHLRVRYEGLLKKPLSGIENVSPPPHFVLIDAMDECGSDDTRRQLIEYLLELSSLVPWLKVIVTSRPDSDIRSFFDQPNTVSVSRCDLQSYSAANDIRAFINVTLGDIAIRDEWPADGVSRLCAKAGELFIWAATACKFIIKADDTQDRFRQLTDESTPGVGFNVLDALYMAVIRNSMADQADDSILNMRRCIGAIVTISMRQPVPIEVLCKIMQPYMKSGVLRKVVGRLGAVIYSDAHLAGAIRVLHPSFADFAMDEARSSIFWVSPIDRNIEVSVGCMSTMEHELRFNICDLETSHLLNSKVSDLESKIEANISGQLAYSCVYWINHVMDCDDKAVARSVANILDNPRLLYWLEVLSVLRRVDVAVKELRELSRWLMSYQRDIAHYTWDAYRFVFAFSDPIIASAPHIYISALPLAPRQSEVSRRLLPLFPNTAVVKGGDETWPKWLGSIPLPAPLHLMCASRDSQKLVVSTFESRDKQETISIFDLRTGGLLRVLERSPVKHQSDFVAVSPNGSLVASGSSCAGFSFWDTDIGTLTHVVDDENIELLNGSYSISRASAFSSDGNTLRLLTDNWFLQGSRDITVWEIEPRNDTKFLLLRVSVDDAFMTDAAFSPNGTQIAVYSSRCLVIYSCSNCMDKVQINWNPQYSIKAIVFSPDGALIAAALNSWDKVGCVQIWDTKTGASIAAFTGQHGEVSSLAFSSDGTQMVTHATSAMQMWDTKACTTIGSPFGVDISNPTRALVFFSPDNTYIFSGCRNDIRIRIWDISSVIVSVDNDPDAAYTLQRSRHSHAVQSVQVWFSPDGTRILSGSSDCSIRAWDAQTGTPIGEALLRTQVRNTRT
ncbi:putative vegetative incompatibility protein HET-E-1 [Rhizoctonia solani 123E]|uniref:Putative vegetative incompatibility protein HET-E-1 n=1 Tax=Rhizoctonia solani 123E TaxID=1423351 RepID=A0A074RKL1_9AGAM|nr:putative vegetative incompatibility protein HET-E-1 [Rhizoctonia solani 123E]